MRLAPTALLLASLSLAASPAPSPVLAGEPAGDRARMHRVADRLERACRAAVEHEEAKREPGYAGLLWGKTAAALATCEFERGLRWFEEGSTEGRFPSPAFRLNALQMLVMAAREGNAGRLADYAAQSNDPDVAATVVAALPAATAAEAEARAALVDGGSPAGAVALLLCALDARETGGDAARLAGRATFVPPAPEGDDAATSPSPLHLDLLRLLAAGDDGGLSRALGGSPETTGEVRARTLGLLAVTAAGIDRWGEASPRTAGLISRIDRALSRLDPRGRFTLVAGIASLFRGEVPDSVTARLAADWDATFLDGDFDFPLCGSVFHATRALLDRDPKRALAMARALADALGRADNPRGYYHAVGTLAGVVARIDSEQAFIIAKRIRSLEWHVHSWRLVYRGWAGRDPKGALAGFDRHTLDGCDLERSIRRDLTLDLAAGLAPHDPRRALALLEALPDCPYRTNHGLFLVAPSLAKVDFEAAMALLEPPDDPEKFQINVVLPLARILMDLAGSDASRFEAADFAECCYPATAWPGPYLSYPLRVP